jgi:hypothetical protein
VSEEIIAHIERLIGYLARQWDKRVRICRLTMVWSAWQPLKKWEHDMKGRADVELQETEEQKESSDFRGDSCSASSVEMYEFSRH